VREQLTQNDTHSPPDFDVFGFNKFVHGFSDVFRGPINVGLHFFCGVVLHCKFSIGCPMVFPPWLGHLASLFGGYDLCVVLCCVVVLAVVVGLLHLSGGVSFCVHCADAMDCARRHYFDAMADDYVVTYVSEEDANTTKNNIVDNILADANH